jgi:hypothetical protein
MDATLARLVDELGLSPHPEGGWFGEMYRSESTLPLPRGERSLCTAIYFLLPAGGFSALHRIRSDEVWCFCDGDPVDLHVLDDAGNRQCFPLGRDLAAGQRPLRVIPAGLWQAAVPRGSRWSLCGCTVTPGFDFEDFAMPTREALVKRFPEHAEWLATVTHEAAPDAPR